MASLTTLETQHRITLEANRSILLKQRQELQQRMDDVQHRLDYVEQALAVHKALPPPAEEWSRAWDGASWSAEQAARGSWA